MTVDITIGKLKIKTFDEVMKEKLEEWNFTHKSTFAITEFLEVEPCPSENDGCTEEDIIYSFESHRSGSIFAMNNFMRNVVGKDLDDYFREMKSNDRQFARIKPVIDEINKLKYTGEEKMHHIRLKWLKFWCNRAVELYGNEAVIEFS
jgi:hypothetical protein